MLAFFAVDVAQIVGCMDAAGDLNLVKIEYRRALEVDKKDGDKEAGEKDVQSPAEILEEFINGVH